jgi:lambda family phage portal protein
MSAASRLWQRATAPLRRKPSPQIRFAGGAHSRIVNNWIAELQSANDEIDGKLATLRARSRQLVRDNGEAAGLLLDFESDIVGAKGAQLQYRALTPRGKPRDPLNDRIEAAWKRWAMRGECTVDGGMSFAALQRLMMRTVVMDGEFLAIRRRDPRAPFGYQLQPIDADQLDETLNRIATASTNAITMGVERDSAGRPVAYHLWNRHPTDVGRVRERVPARDVLHVFKRLRVGQVRGVPWFAPALVTWKLGDRYTEAELYQSLLAAAQGGFFVNKDASSAMVMPMRVNPETGREEPVPIQMEAAPGGTRQLPPGWEFQPWQPTHPTANYVGFMKAVKRIVARAFGRSYASLTGDLSDVNFSSMRTDRVREIEQNRLHQQDLLVEQLCQVVFGDWVQMAAMVGALGAVPIDAAQMASFADWMCKGWPWIDPMKDMAAAQMEIGMGLNSPQRLCAEKGRDFYEIVDELADAKAYCAEKGVTLESVPLQLVVETTPDDAPTTDDEGARARPPLRITA